MSLSYGWEKLHNAIHSLCGQGSQAARLINAVAYSLIHIDPKNDIPEDIRDEFKDKTGGRFFVLQSPIIISTISFYQKEHWGQASRLHIFFFYFCFIFYEFVKPDPRNLLRKVLS